MIDEIPVGVDPAIGAAVERSRSRLSGLETGLRSLSSGLGPATLKSEGLAVALGRLGGDTRVEVRVDVETADLPDDLASAVYFICAESIANALKHASASTIAVHLRAQDERSTARRDRRMTEAAGLVPSRGSGLQGLVDQGGCARWYLRPLEPTGPGDRNYRRPPDRVKPAVMNGGRPDDGVTTSTSPIRGNGRARAQSGGPDTRVKCKVRRASTDHFRWRTGFGWLQHGPHSQ